MIPHTDEAQRRSLQRYYKLHARIYDATRWSFLFGRQALLKQVSGLITPRRVLEIGCGTGANLQVLAKRFPEAHITGVDLSAEMLKVARRKLLPWADRITLQHQAYTAPLPDAFDLIVFSYALSMFNPGWEQALQSAGQNLNQNGLLAVVDFADTRHAFFRNWMALNHVRMAGHLLPALNAHFSAVHCEQRSAYAGLWRYLMFIGSNRNQA